MNHQLKLHILTNSSATPQKNPKQLSVEQILTRFSKISNKRKMVLSSQMVLVYLRVILKIQIKTKKKKKANLISKNILRVSRTIWRYDSELRNWKLVKNFKLFPKFKKLLPQLSTLLLCQDPPPPQWRWQKLH